jgi:type IV pilus assembly protein PilX
MTHALPQPHHGTDKQRGVALIISLILLVVMTLLGMAAIRSITSEERMATQTYDRSLAFQATESALKSAELLLEALPTKPTPAVGAGCTLADNLMVCAPPATADTPRWKDDDFASWQNATTVGSDTLAITPQYFVEYLGDAFACQPGNASDPMNCKRYRVTARSPVVTGRASVVLQSVYATE